MSYENVTPHEIRISQNLQKIAKKLQRIFIKETGAEVDFILCTSSRAGRDQQQRTGEVPVGNYFATMDRETAAMSMLELIGKWEALGTLPPIHTLRDDNGRTLEEILESGIN